MEVFRNSNANIYFLKYFLYVNCQLLCIVIYQVATKFYGIYMYKFNIYISFAFVFTVLDCSFIFFFQVVVVGSVGFDVSVHDNHISIRQFTRTYKLCLLL